jgi:glycerol transport system ATP-binding protein
MFGGRDAVVVYATTEPLEALMLQGATAVIAEGKLLQAGPTLEVYHQPASVRVGDVFSDPSMNMIDGRVEGPAATLGGDISVPLEGHLAGLPPAEYRFGVRANHLFVVAGTEGRIPFDATVELAEISGSETFIHATRNGVSWVIQEEGVHSFRLGQPIQIFISPRHLFAFDAAGRLAAAPVRGAPRPNAAPEAPRETRWHASS